MINLIIVRHGKTDWNNQHRLQGATNIPLNEAGENDAKNLSSEIGKMHIDVCLCSPLDRAHKTAQILAGDLPIVINDNLIERTFGEFEGVVVDDNLIHTMWNYDLNYGEKGVESIRECLKRAEQILSKIQQEYNNKTVLIVTHASLIKALHFNLIGYDKNTNFLSFHPRNTTIYKYILE